MVQSGMPIFNGAQLIWKSNTNLSLGCQKYLFGS
jgi:hypothetical protein